MSLSYNLAISKDSIWKVHTPGEQTRQLPFYINEVGYFKCDSSFFTKRNEQNDYELIYTCDGLGQIEYEGNVTQLKKGDAYIIDCFKLNLYNTVPGEKWDIKWIHFNGSSADLYYKNITKNGNHVKLNNFHSFDFQFNVILNLPTEQNMYTNFAACEYLVHLLTDLFQSSYKSSQNFHSYSSEIQTALEFIKENYHKQVTLDDLCDHIHMSKYYFINVFKNYTGSTPHEYIVNYRIGKAKHLLRTTNLSINEICQHIGFNDQSYFIKIFRKLNNITPNKYRMNM